MGLLTYYVDPSTVTGRNHFSMFSRICSQFKPGISIQYVNGIVRNVSNNIIYERSKFKTVSNLVDSSARTLTTSGRFCVSKLTVTMRACKLITEENVKNILDSVDTILTDCDGVLWNDAEAIPGAPEAVQLLVNKLGKKIFYVSNNSLKTRAEYKAKFTKLGFPAEESNIVGSAYVTAKYIKNTLNYSGKVYMIGSTGLQQELEAVGIKQIGLGPDNDVYESLTERANVEIDPEIKCVVLGFDHYYNYNKMLKAAAYLGKKDCLFVATNSDAYLPMGDRRNLPGTGSLLEGLEVAAQRKATICGKPYKPIIDVLMKEYNVDPARTIMIGDRLDTDIALGANCGIRTLFVQSGASTLEEVRHWQSSNSLEHQKLVPDFYLPSLDVLRALIKAKFN